MDNTVHIKNYSAPPINKRDILRYAGVKGDAPELDRLLCECVDEIKIKLVYRVVHRELTIERDGSYIIIGTIKTESNDLRKNLDGCDSAILFAATVGIEIDRAIARHASVSPTKSLMLQAIGTERVESLCDLFNGEISESRSLIGGQTRPRFSPGYGDLPLSLQTNIFDMLDCQRKIGLTLNESLLMSPSKSVTAIIGVKNGNTRISKE